MQRTQSSLLLVRHFSFCTLHLSSSVKVYERQCCGLWKMKLVEWLVLSNTMKRMSSVKVISGWGIRLKSLARNVMLIMILLSVIAISQHTRAYEQQNFLRIIMLSSIHSREKLGLKSSEKRTLCILFKQYWQGGIGAYLWRSGSTKLFHNLDTAVDLYISVSDFFNEKCSGYSPSCTYIYKKISLP